MRKLLLTIFIAALSCSLFAQAVPSKLTKGINVVKDDFTGETTYESPASLVKVVQRSDSTELQIFLSCVAYDTPTSLEKILVLANGETITFDDVEQFKLRETPERYMSKAASGTFGTSSYRGAEFSTRNKYTESLTVTGDKALSLARSFSTTGGKIRYQGQNQTIDYEIPSKVIKESAKVLAIYDYITNEL